MSEVVETDSGFHILKLEERSADAHQPLAEVSEDRIPRAEIDFSTGMVSLDGVPWLRVDDAVPEFRTAMALNPIDPKARNGLRYIGARLLQLQQEEQDEAHASARKEQVKSGGRSEKIRTYNYKDNRVTDHRVGLTVYALDRVLDGDLDEFIDALAGDERQRQLGGE